ncbi:MFS transporter [Paraburkholderia monticola]|uniref:MFS transporter n=1 Tax=Paraburkholderia monticola TaxID=1399968 RepID=A0A149PFQ8_9BURK|nr:MFS transporter [Paraburkholderia monticola]KXU83842.1 MFS transporter [Paraburkholderia monticola]
MATQETSPALVIEPGARRRAIVSSVIGNGLEWFDFGIFSSFSVIISRLMFPPQSGPAMLMIAFASFGIAFVIRPFGGVLLGMYADRAGRKAALSAIILMMSAGTLLIGLTPTYATIGIAASALIVLARMLQGFSAGGEFASATAMLLEYAPQGQRNLIGSFQACSQALSFALGGTVAYLLLHNLTPASLHGWGWRLPFLFGSLIGPIGYYIRSRVDESPEFAAFIKRKHRAPTDRLSLAGIVRHYPRQLLATLGIVAVGTASSYVGLIYIPLFASGQLGLDPGTAQLGMVAGSLVLLVMCPLTGYLADRYGRRRVMLPAMLLYGVLAYPLLASLVNAPDARSLIRFEVVSAFLMSFFWGPSAAALAEAFPVQIRSTGMAIVYNLGAMCFGGLAPLINTWLTKVTGDRLAPAWYIAASVVLGVIGVLAMTQREPLARQSSQHA